MSSNSRYSVSDEELLKALAAHPGKPQEVAKATGLSVSQVHRRKALMARKGVVPEQGLTHAYPDGYMLGKVTVQRNQFGEIERTWERMCSDQEQMQIALRAGMEAMVAELPRLAPRQRRAGEGGAGDRSRQTRTDLLTVYPIGDPHIGMYSWAPETGDDWDLDIAERVHCGAMASLVEAAPPTSKALIIELGDLFHYDSLETKTPRSGHFVDADGRYAKMIHVGVKIMRQCIQSALEKHDEVEVMCIPGNHDETGALWLALALATHYENEPRVTVQTHPALFSYYRFGKVLIGAHHGHSCKPDKLPGVMAADRAEDWGQTLHRYWMMGHIHHESKKEYPGCSVESFNTLAGKDAYAQNGGWRSNRSMQALVFHEEYGEVARSKVNVALVEDREKAA